MKLDELRHECGWQWSTLAREADIDAKTLYRARNRIAVSGETADKLAKAFSRKLKREIRFQDIEDLITNV